VIVVEWEELHLRNSTLGRCGEREFGSYDAEVSRLIQHLVDADAVLSAWEHDGDELPVCLYATDLERWET